MRRPICAAALFTAAVCARAQQCAQDSQGNKVCVKQQANQNICYSYKIPPGIISKVNCNDVVVQKTSPDGTTIYTRVLTGESDQQAKQFVIDASNNVVVLGTTYSKQFPVTPDALQSVNAGPALSSGSFSVQPGGDLFLSVVSSSGALVYSTFLGSSGNDTVLGLHAATGTQVDVLASVGGSNFPMVPATNPVLSSGPVLFTFDSGSRTLTRSGYLPIATQGTSVPYVAAMQSDGSVTVTTPSALYTFGRDGQPRSQVSLASFAFVNVPQTTSDPSGDLWLVGQNTANQYLVAKLTAGIVEAFRWTLPAAGSSLPYLLAPFFGPDGSAYLGGSATLLSTTPNALLTAPCSQYSFGIVAVLSLQGDVKLLTYTPGVVSSFSANPDGTVSALLSSTQAIVLDLSLRPKAACVVDALDRLSSPPPALGVGEVVRLRGGGFGPALDNLSVQVGGVDAPVLSAGSGEVVFAIPFATLAGNSILVTVQDHGQQSDPIFITVRQSAPWLIDPIWNQDWTRNWFDSPATWGSVITLFVTGAGPYSPPLADGQIAPLDTTHGLQLPVSVSFLITGPEPEPAKILYAGPAPGQIGVAQINVQLPASAPYSSFSGVLTIGSVSTGLPSIWVGQALRLSTWTLP